MATPRPHDIDLIKERVRAVIPGVKIDQLKVAHPGVDDDGLWFFRRDGEKATAQIESSTYDLPFLIETDTPHECVTAFTVDEVIEVLRAFFAEPN